MIYIKCIGFDPPCLNICIVACYVLCFHNYIQISCLRMPVSILPFDAFLYIYISAIYTKFLVDGYRLQSYTSRHIFKDCRSRVQIRFYERTRSDFQSCQKDSPSFQPRRQSYKPGKLLFIEVYVIVVGVIGVRVIVVTALGVIGLYCCGCCCCCCLLFCC